MIEPMTFSATLGPTLRKSMSTCFTIIIADSEGTAHLLRRCAGEQVRVTISSDFPVIDKPVLAVEPTPNAASVVLEAPAMSDVLGGAESERAAAQADLEGG